MPRPAKKKETAERGFVKGTYGVGVYMTLDCFPHLTFWGRTKEDAKRNALGELARKFPQGYSLEFDDS